MTSTVDEAETRCAVRSALRRARCCASAGAPSAHANAANNATRTTSRSRELKPVAMGRSTWILAGLEAFAAPGYSYRAHGTRIAALHRVEQHALRPAERPDRDQPPFADAVVDRPPRDAEHLGGVVERHAAANSRLESGLRHLFLCVVSHRNISSAVSQEIIAM